MVFSFLGGPKAGGKTKTALRGPEEVRAYWEGLRQNGSIPSRADLDPRGMADVLDRIFVAERIGTGLVRLRIAGMSLTEIGGMDMKGLPLSALFVPEARLRLAGVLERVLSRPQAAALHLEAERGIGRPAMRARLLLLPLRSAGGNRDLVLGCLATDGETGRAPRRFAITHAVEEHLAVAQPLAQATPMVPAFAEVAGPAPQPSYLTRPVPGRPVPGHPHLRLVHSV